MRLRGLQKNLTPVLVKSTCGPGVLHLVYVVKMLWPLVLNSFAFVVIFVQQFATGFEVLFDVLDRLPILLFKR